MVCCSNIWHVHTNFYNQNTRFSWQLQIICIYILKLWVDFLNIRIPNFTTLLLVWSKKPACGTNSPQNRHKPYYSVWNRNCAENSYSGIWPFLEIHTLKWNFSHHKILTHNISTNVMSGWNQIEPRDLFHVRWIKIVLRKVVMYESVMLKTPCLGSLPEAGTFW